MGGQYPWGGRFVEGRKDSCVAAVTLSEEFDLPKDRVALFGNMKTENLGVEKVVANVISNPNIRFLIVCGTEVRGHRSGESLVCLHKSGIDGNNRVVGAKSAIPFIENLPGQAIERFREQVEIINLIGVTDVKTILKAQDECIGKNPGPFGPPLVIEPITHDRVVEVLRSDFALHGKVVIDPYGVVSQAPEAS